MNKHYKEAQSLIEEAVEKLSEIIEAKGEDKNISCYDPSSLQEPVRMLVNATSSMVMGRAADKGWVFRGTTTTGRMSSTNINILNAPRENDDCSK